MYGVDDALVAGMALSLAGTGASIAGNQEAQGAMDSAREAEMQRQQGYQKQGAKRLAQSLQESTAPRNSKVLNQEADARNAAYQQLQQSAPMAVSATPPTPNRTVTTNTPAGEAAARSSTATNAWTRLANESASKNAAYGDWGLQRGIEQGRAAQEQEVINNKARGSLSVLPIEMEQASHAGDAMQTVGTVASALGSIGMMYGATVPTVAATEAAPATGAGAGAAAAGSGAGLTSSLVLGRRNPWASLNYVE